MQEATTLQHGQWIDCFSPPVQLFDSMMLQVATCTPRAGDDAAPRRHRSQYHQPYSPDCTSRCKEASEASIHAGFKSRHWRLGSLSESTISRIAGSAMSVHMTPELHLALSLSFPVRKCSVYRAPFSTTRRTSGHICPFSPSGSFLGSQPSSRQSWLALI